MKKIILYIFSFTFLSAAAFGQDLEFPTNTPVWKEVHTTIAGPLNRYFAVCGDIEIDGIQYNRLLEVFVDGNLEITDKVIVGGIRQEGPKVYLQYIGDVSKFLLYDFSLQQGDEITLEMPFGLPPDVRTVTEVETEMIEGKIRRIIYFEEEDPNCPYEPEYWIEGIGSSYGLLNRGFSPCNGADIGSTLSCFQYLDEYVNLTLIECFLPQNTGPACGLNSASEKINAGQLLSVFPNPVHDKITIDIPANRFEEAAVHVYSALGEQVIRTKAINYGKMELEVADLPAGIYFIRVQNKAGELIGVSKFIKE